jgi:hypothetical protein
VAPEPSPSLQPEVQGDKVRGFAPESPQCRQAQALPCRKSDQPQGQRIAQSRGSRTVLTLIVTLAVCLTCAPARADIGVVLNESLDSSVARVTGSGHTAVYFSRICADTPVKLRLCEPGESGSVMSNYTTLGESEPFEWNIVPLSVYVYGVEDPRNRPLLATADIKRALEESYREKFLTAYCYGPPCTTSGGAEWREMVGAGLSRSIYIFAVKTTIEQDQALINEFNSLPNVNHFNPITRNCANFTKSVVDRYFPGAARRDWLNDFGMASPKAIARSFTHYGLKHPGLHLHILHFAQVPGTIKRSTETRDGTEQLYHSKKLLVPMVLFAPHELPFFTAAYLLTGRFNPEHEWEAHPAIDAVEAPESPALAGRASLTPENDSQRTELVGTAERWQHYRGAFDEISETAERDENSSGQKSWNGLPKRLEKTAFPVVAADGALWLKVAQDGETATVGLSASNLLATDSDRSLAHELILSRINAVLKTPKHARESMAEFEEDWTLLQSFSSRSITELSADTN